MPYNAVDALNDRLALDWSRFGSRAYELVREIHRRTSEPDPLTGGKPDRRRRRGAKYEDSIFKARERLSRANV